LYQITFTMTLTMMNVHNEREFWLSAMLSSKFNIKKSLPLFISQLRLWRVTYIFSNWISFLSLVRFLLCFGYHNKTLALASSVCAIHRDHITLWGRHELYCQKKLEIERGVKPDWVKSVAISVSLRPDETDSDFVIRKSDCVRQ
jgi:hypothetical protein